MKTNSATVTRSPNNKRISSNVTMQIPSFPEGKDTLRNPEGNRLPFKVCLIRRLLYHNPTKIAIKNIKFRCSIPQTPIFFFVFTFI